MSNSKLLRVNDVMDMLAVSKSQVWYLTKIKELKSFKLSKRITVWKLEEIEAYIASKVA